MRVVRGLFHLIAVIAPAMASSQIPIETGDSNQAARAVGAIPTDPVEALLWSSKRSYEDNGPQVADSLASEALQTPGISRTQRIRALQLIAAANFSSLSSERDPERALETLRQLVAFAPLASPPRSLSWSGLDSLYSVARRTTFGMAVTVEDSVGINGFDGFVPIAIYATRPVNVDLVLEGDRGTSAPIIVDSVRGASQVNLRFQPVLGESPRFPSGDYTAVVRGRDPETRQERVVRVHVQLHTPPLPLHRIPDTWDSAGARPERTRPSRASSVISGLLIGSFTALTIRAGWPDELDGGPSPNSRALGWGIGLGVGTTVGSWLLDRGRRISENESYNAKLYDDWMQHRARMLEENREWSRGYQGYALLTLEDR